MAIIAIAYSDIHHAIWNQYNFLNRRLSDSIEVEKIIKLASKKYKVPVLFCGDLLHKDKYMSNELMAYLLPALNKLHSSGHKTYAISGNHDQDGENTKDNPAYSYISTFSNIFPNFECIDFGDVRTENFHVFGIPYLTHDIGLKQLIKEVSEKRSKKLPNILMLHTTLPGATDTNDMQMITHLDNSIYELLADFDLVLTGHIHAPMKLAKNVYQLGAPNHQRKTDKGKELGYWLIHDNLKMEFVHIKQMPKFIELEPGQEFPDSHNFYYHRETNKVDTTENVVDTGTAFNNIFDKEKLAKNFLKATNVKDKQKKQALLKAIEE